MTTPWHGYSMPNGPLLAHLMKQLEAAIPACEHISSNVCASLVKHTVMSPSSTLTLQTTHPHTSHYTHTLHPHPLHTTHTLHTHIPPTLKPHTPHTLHPHTPPTLHTHTLHTHSTHTLHPHTPPTHSTYTLHPHTPPKCVSCHTGSVCFPVLAVDLYRGLEPLSLSVYTATVPSYNPTAMR